MLSDSSYMTAVYAYCGAALLFILCLAWWFGRRWPNGWSALLVLLVAALMLTPAYPREGIDSLAPALVVAGFQLATEGVDAAAHALRPLAAACALATGVALLVGLTLWRKRKGPANQTAETKVPARAEQS